ncbi:Ig-like domain-containing protein [Collimonas sp.]|uniref:Ig-like domain-containing protein n=1 Tax=Collimonas sp. TaxID=1963772 RepID=UPI002B857805|nr:Ig-like domain-containing protein [Collimonas sp.]HWX01532.1 Ig-like domain-containing protein [Collimonas sp.]
MAANAVKLFVVNGKQITQSIDLHVQGSAAKVKAPRGGKFILAEADSGAAPENITVQRVGNDLQLSLEGAEQPALIIEDYYGQDGQQAELVGVAEDGAYYTYIANDASGLLADGASSAQVLGRQPLLGFGEGLAPTSNLMNEVWPWLAGLGTLLGVALLLKEHHASPPPAPTIDHAFDNVGSITGNIANGGLSNDPRPLLSGSGKAGAVVTISEGGVVLGSATVAADGSWSFAPAANLSDGLHHFTVTQADAGGSSPASTAYDLLIDTIALAPQITNAFDDVGSITGNVASGGLTNDPRPALSGSGEAGAVVVVRDGATVLGSTTVAADGTWRFTPGADLSDGLHHLSATQLDQAGNLSPLSTDYDLLIDTVSLPPTILTVLDNQLPISGPVASGGITNDKHPVISGTAEANAMVIVSDGATVLGSVQADGSGHWTFLPPDLGEGMHHLSATATDLAGNVSAPSSLYPFTVDTIAPAAPLINSVMDSQEPVVGDVRSNGGVTNDNHPVISGTAEANSIVILMDGATVLGSVQADGKGNWSIPSPDLSDGSHDLTATATDAAGNVSKPSADYPFIVDTVPPAAPLINTVLDNQEPVVGDVRSNGGVTNDNHPVISGTAEANSIVILMDGATVLGSVQADGKGNWSISSPDLSDGSHDLTATATDAAGNVSAPSADYPFIVDTVPPAAPLINTVLDSQEPVVGDVRSNGGVTNDNHPVISGTAEANSIVILMDGATVLGSVQADADGNWSIPSPDLSDGSHDLTATATDAAGNVSAPSADYAFAVLTVPPAAQAIITGMGKDSGADAGDFLTNDGSAGRLVHGTLTAALETGQKVQVSTDGGLTWSDALVSGSNWNFQDNASHSGDWIIQTRVIDAASNTTTGASQAVTLDTTVGAPTAMSWDGFNIDISFDGTALTLGSKVHVVIDGVIVEHVLSQAEIDAGSAAVPWSSAVNGNASNITAAVVDNAGNLSLAREFLKENTSTVTEDLSTQPAQVFTTVGEVIHLSNFDLTVVQLNATNPWLPGFSMNQAQWADPSPSIALVIRGGDEYRLTLPDTESYSFISMTVGDFNSNERVLATFYDQDGNAVHQVSLAPTGTSLRVDVSAELPYGLHFSSVTLESPGNGAYWINDIQFGRNEYANSPTLLEPDLHQTVSQAAQYYGDTADNLFALADVSLLDGADSGIHGGGGTDTLQLTGAGQVLDLTLLGDKIDSIEIIDLTGSGNNTLNLSLNDVLEQGGRDLFLADGKTQMMVKGDAGDVVNLNDLLPDGSDIGDWAQAADAVTVDGVAYNVYQHSNLDAELLVQQGVTTNLV